MKNREIAIIGAGNGGRAFAAYLSKLGYKVNLCFRTPINIYEIYQTKRIISEGEITGSYRLHRVSINYAKIISNAQIILIVLPANLHKSIINKLMPYLKNGHIILLNPGRTWGAIEVYNEIKKKRPDITVYVAETQTLIFTSRKIQDYGVEIHKIKKKVDYCFYPEYNNKKIGPILEHIFPQLNRVDDIRITSLNNIGAVIHPPTVLLNAGSITRNGDFYFYKEGILPPIARVIELIDKEKCAIMEKLGMKPVTLIEWINSVYGIQTDDYFTAFQMNESYQNIKAPQSIRVRYLTEDIPTGLVPLSSLGKKLGIPTPTIDSIIQLADIMLGTDFKETGRTIEKVGLWDDIEKQNSRDIAFFTCEANTNAEN